MNSGRISLGATVDQPSPVPQSAPLPYDYRARCTSHLHLPDALGSAPDHVGARHKCGMTLKPDVNRRTAAKPPVMHQDAVPRG